MVLGIVFGGKNKPPIVDAAEGLTPPVFDLLGDIDFGGPDPITPRPSTSTDRLQGLLDELRGISLFQPEPFNAGNINVPLISPSGNFRNLESSIANPSSPFQQALRGASFSDDVTNFFNRDVAPGILQQFSGGPRGGGVFSGAARSALAGEFARLQENERQQQFQRAFQAAPIAAQIFDVDRQTRAQQLTNKIAVWAQQQGFGRDAVSQALQLAGLNIRGEANLASIEESQRQFDFNVDQANRNAEIARDAAIFGTVGTLLGGAAGGALGGPLGASVGAALGGGLGAAAGGQPQFLLPTAQAAIQGPAGVAVQRGQSFGQVFGFGGPPVQPNPIFTVPAQTGIGGAGFSTFGNPGITNPFLLQQTQPGVPATFQIGVPLGVGPDLDPFSSAQTFQFA